MLAVFEKSISTQPAELILPGAASCCSNIPPEEIAETFRSWKSDSTFYHLSNCNFLALSRQDENPAYPRSIVVMDDIFCLFSGALQNTLRLKRRYGLSTQATEAMIIIEACKVLRGRVPCPSEQVLKEIEGKFAFILFDNKASILFLARDRDGEVELHWGTASDGSLVCADDPNVITASCGNYYTPFPPGCIFTSGKGLIRIDYPASGSTISQHRHPKEDGEVDHCTRLHYITAQASKNIRACNSI